MSEDAPSMGADPHEDLAAALGKFIIHSPTVFTFGHEPPVDVRMLQLATGWGGAIPQAPMAGGSGGDDPLLRVIQAKLYDRCYARRSGNQAATPTQGQLSGQISDPNFARRLVAANAGRERWDKGWAIHQFGPNGQAFVRKGDRERVAMPGAFIFDGIPGMAPQIGATVSLRVPHDTFDAQPGYYFAFGDTLDELADNLTLVRLYFHCGSESAVLLVGELTAALNRFQTPFQLKTPAAPELYGRTDAAVLYIGARYFPIAARIVASVLDKIPVETATPLFTKHLWPGVGAAVEPGSGESFGSHRCRLTAEGIVGAWRQDGAQETPKRMAAVAARFAAAGLDLQRPWLGPGGVDPFQTPDPARLP
jgi:HopA1 effector protein family